MWEVTKYKWRPKKDMTLQSQKTILPIRPYDPIGCIILEVFVI